MYAFKIIELLRFTLNTELLFCKGLSQSSVGIERMSDIIGQQLGINCSALMGANIAHEVALEQFCESTIGKIIVVIGS